MRCLFLFLLAWPAAAQSFLLSGHLDDGDVPASGTFTVILSLTDDDTTLWTEQQSGVVVVDGIFAVDVGAAEPLPLAVPSTARLSVVVDGDALPPFPLSRLTQATRADVASHVPTADSADLVGGTSGPSAASRAHLGTLGQASVPFTSLSGLPAGVADGDQGTDVLGVADGLALSGRKLSMQSVNGNKLAVGSVDAVKLAGVSVTSAQIADGALTGAKISDGSVSGDRLAQPLTEREVKGRIVFRVNSTNCPEPAGTLTTKSSCTPPSCRVGLLAGREGCDATTCSAAALALPCPNDALGVLVE